MGGFNGISKEAIGGGKSPKPAIEKAVSITMKNVISAFVGKRKNKRPKLGMRTEKSKHRIALYEFPEELRRLIYANSLSDILASFLGSLKGT